MRAPPLTAISAASRIPTAALLGSGLIWSTSCGALSDTPALKFVTRPAGLRPPPRPAVAARATEPHQLAAAADRRCPARSGLAAPGRPVRGETARDLARNRLR